MSRSQQIPIVLFVVIGLGALVASALWAGREWQRQSWTPIEGRVVGEGRESRNATTGDVGRMLEVEWTDTEGRAHRFVGWTRWGAPPGSPVLLRYDGEDPETIEWSTPLNPAVFVPGIIGLVFVFLGVKVWRNAARASRTAPPHGDPGAPTD